MTTDQASLFDAAPPAGVEARHLDVVERPVPDLPDLRTLEDAQRWLADRLDDGARCPCCALLAKRYRRRIESRSVRALIALYRRHGREWGHVRDLGIKTGAVGGGISLLRYWALVEERDDEDDYEATGTGSGWWRITDAGERFVRGETTVQSHAITYGGDLLRLDGDLVDARWAVGRRFNFDELMAGT